MVYVVAFAALYLVAGLAMVSELGTGNSAKLEEARLAANKARQEIAPAGNFYVNQFKEAVASYR